MFLTNILALALIPGAMGHMEMMQPYALRSKYDPANKQSGNIDYSMTSPLESSGSNFPCKGYQNDRPIRTVATYQAGSNYTVKLAGTATHGGGSCQLSLSYDNGKTFRVIKSMIGGCPLQDSYDFQIPSYAPAGTALLGWTWVNLVGNREYYMNCAEVEIQGGSGAQSPMQRRHLHRHLRQARDASSSFESLPTIWRANMPSVNTCKTQEGKQVVYPHPGPDVVYGSGLTASDPSTDGTCDSASPPGPTYKDLSTGGATSEGNSGSGSSGSAPASSNAAAPKPSVGTGMQPKKGSPFGDQPTGSDPDAALSSLSMAPLPAQTSAASSPAPAAPSATLPVVAPSASSPGDSAPFNSTGSIGSCDIFVGGLKCLRNGQGFAVCNEGEWVDMGSVAAGTVCKNGVIGAALPVVS